tara:strand:+ start:86589 stop:87134 length:546 start_codon:yes stop_codon:yes gene_type:complete
MKLSLLFTFILIIGCTSSKKIVEATPESRALDELVANKKFMIESNWASPRASTSLNALSNSGLLGAGNSSGSINLIGNSNFLKIEGDTISAELPYYGERQMGGGYTSEAGVKFKGIPKKYEAIKDNTSQRNIITLQINNATESYNITITLFPNWTSSIVINSSQRTPISYQGNVLEIPEKK